jgi:hypothetical protein
MSFSYNRVWDETVRTVRGNASLLVAVAGVFIFLPTLIAAYLAPAPQAQTMAAMGEYYRENFLTLLIAQIVSFIGNLAVLTLVLDDRRPTVGGSITGAFGMLPAYFLVSLLSGLMILGGLMLLIVPGLYLVGRLSAAGPALVAERRRNPFDIISRSFAITKGNGWAVLGLIILVFVAFYILMLALTLVIGSMLLLIDRASGASIGSFLLLILTSATTAAFNTVLMVLVASIYRNLAGAVAQPSLPPTSGI